MLQRSPAATSTLQDLESACVGVPGSYYTLALVDTDGHESQVARCLAGPVEDLEEWLHQQVDTVGLQPGERVRLRAWGPDGTHLCSLTLRPSQPQAAGPGSTRGEGLNDERLRRLQADVDSISSRLDELDQTAADAVVQLRDRITTLERLALAITGGMP